MLRRTLIFMTILTLSLAVCLAEAAMQLSGNPAPLKAGDNLLAAAVYNDSPGSSDLTLIIQLKADDQILIDEGSPCKAIEPKEDLPSKDDPTGWTKPDFDDSSWQDAKYGVGYGDGDDNTEIGSKAANTVSIYTRAWFTISNPSSINKLELGVDYDDACVIFINGVEVARTAGTDIPDKPHWDSWSDKGSGQTHEASKTDPPTYEWLEVPFEIISAVTPVSKAALTWGALKEMR